MKLDEMNVAKILKPLLLYVPFNLTNCRHFNNYAIKLK
jgi:hypothetical protein